MNHTEATAWINANAERARSRGVTISLVRHVTEGAKFAAVDYHLEFSGKTGSHGIWISVSDEGRADAHLDGFLSSYPTPDRFDVRTGARYMPGWMYNNDADAKPGEALRWSGRSMPPAVGERVNAPQFGEGVVKAYFWEHGYLGVEVLLDRVPTWLAKQWKTKGKTDRLARLFGVDLRTPAPAAEAVQL